LANTLDSALTVRLREIAAGGTATEAELRELGDQAGGWARALEAQIAAGERKLTTLASDPATSMVTIAGVLRRVERLRPELAEVRGLLEALDDRAHELRAGWLRAALER
jgi:hypothetical protein